METSGDQGMRVFNARPRPRRGADQCEGTLSDRLRPVSIGRPQADSPRRGIGRAGDALPVRRTRAALPARSRFVLHSLMGPNPRATVVA